MTKMEDMIADLRQEVYELRHRKVMIWADTTTSMDSAVDETWHYVTAHLPEGFSVAEVQWARSIRNVRILKVDLVYEWAPGLTEVKRTVLDAFVRVPRPYNEEVVVITHRAADWKMTHPDFVESTRDVRRATTNSIADREALKKGVVRKPDAGKIQEGTPE